jgi:conjugative relaxase-like TrwC/TraI family protein
MLRIREKTDPQAAKAYYRQSDYYLETPGEWMGRGAGRLGLTGRAQQEDFEALCDNLRPDGSQLTALNVDGRRVGWDFNFNASKSVSIAREIVGHFDPEEGRRIEDAHREAVAYAMGQVERDMRVRVRAGGKDEDRITGNMIALRVTHRTTRPNEDDFTPDMALHDHVFVINASFDDEEGGKAKAAQVGDIVHDAPYYEALYHNRLACNLRALGYGVRRTAHGFEIAGVADTLIERFSRRKATIEKLADSLGLTGADARGKLGATSRLSKSGSRLVELAPYWLGKLSDDEREALRRLKGQPSQAADAASAMRFAIDHLFYRASVVEDRKLYETAVRHGIGRVTLEEVEAEARRQGVLFQAGEVSTRAVLDQEQRIIGYARESRGRFRPLAPGRTEGLEELSDEQAAAVRHVWNSRDGLMLIRGAPGAGKTTMMKPALDRIGAPAVLLAPSADASRDSLRRSGFKDADTVAAFLTREEMQDQARSGVIWIDEASLLPIDDLERVCAIAERVKARIVLQGDPRQHKAVQRHGNMLETLADHAGLQVAEINTIQRQRGSYVKAVEAIRAGQYEQGVDLLYELGWIVEGQGHEKLLAEYARDLAESKAGREVKPVLIVDPTHKDGGALTAKLRALRKEAGAVHGPERTFAQWTATKWTPAEQADPGRYAGDEVIQFFRNNGRFRAGQRVTAAELLPHLGKLNPAHFAVYRPGEVSLAAGDVIRITANGRDVTGKHRVDNGRIDTIAGFTRSGDIKLANGWVIARDFAHLTHGLVSTSPAAQSKDRAVTWQQLNRVSLGAAGAEQFLVSLSRGKERGLVFTDLSRDELVAAIRRADRRKSATELFTPVAKPAPAAQAAERAWTFMERMRLEYQQFRRRTAGRLAQGRESFTQREGLAYER